MNDFSDIYTEYAAPVHRYLLSLTHDVALAEELTQETLYRAFKSMNKFKKMSSLYSWLCQIAKNLYLDEMKKKSRAVTASSPDLLDGLKDERWAYELLLKEHAMQVHHVLHSLPEPYKEVFMLKVFGELKFKDIAQLFNRTESWAKMTFYRAKEQIVKRMEENK